MFKTNVRRKLTLFPLCLISSSAASRPYFPFITGRSNSSIMRLGLVYPSQDEIPKSLESLQQKVPAEATSVSRLHLKPAGNTSRGKSAEQITRNACICLPMVVRLVVFVLCVETLSLDNFLTSRSHIARGVLIMYYVLHVAKC